MSLHTHRRSATHGPRVVFCHGLFGQGKNWTQVAKALSADHRVLLLDMPNHGRSPWTETFDYVELADLVAAELGRRAGRARRALDGRQDRDVPRAAAPRAGRAAGRRRRRPGGLRQRARVRRLHRDDAGPGPRRPWSAAARPRRRCARRCPTRSCAASCCRTCAAPTTAGTGRSTSTCSASTWTSWSAGPASALGDASYDGPVLWVGRRRLRLHRRRARRARWTAGSRATAGC